MKEVITKSEFDKKYLLLKKDGLCENYIFKMLTQNRIQGLLECKPRYLEENEYLAYDVTAKRTLEKEFLDKKMGFGEIADLFYGINRIMNQAKEYLLDSNGFWLHPKYMYLDLDTDELSCLYFPCAELKDDNTDGSYRQLADFLLDKIDHRDEHAVNIAYLFYKISKEEYFSFDSFIGLLEKEYALVQAKNRQREKTDERNNISEIKESEPIIESGEKECVEEFESAKRNWKWILATFIPGIVLIMSFLLIVDLRKYATYILVPGITFIIFSVVLLVRNVIDMVRENRDFTYEEPDTPVLVEEYFEDMADDMTVFFDEDEFLKLKWKEGHFSKEFLLQEFPVTIGKMKNSAQMVIEDPSISRLHARFRQQGNTVYLQDLESTNGTYVNDKQLFPGEEMIIKRGDEIQFGKIIVNVV